LNYQRVTRSIGGDILLIWAIRSVSDVIRRWVINPALFDMLGDI
jgi:hypothetical protein